ERDFVSTVLDTAKALVVVLDTQGRIIRFNRECEQLTGYSFDEVQGKTFWDLFLLPEDIDIIKSKFNTFQSGDYPRKNENAWLTKDGMPKQIAWSNSVLKDKDDRVTNIIAIGIEITERKHMEEALRETRDYLENLVDHANAPIIVWDSSFRITRFNQAFERLTYLKADEVLGKQLDVLFPDGSKKDSMNLIRGTLTGERWETVEIPILRADKSVRIVLWNSANILGRDGTEVVATIAQGQDITDRKRMETELEQMVKELQETRDYLENLINYANAPIIVWDSSFMITRFNNAFEKLTGFKAAEVLGNHLDILFPSGSKRDSMNLIQSTLAGERWETVEIPILRTDGSERIVLWNSANILSQDGIEVIATIAQGQDITDRKRMETELEQMVLERTVELSAAKEELGMINEALRVEIAEHEKLELDLLKARDAAEKAARAKSAFMANMSHEIRTPMNSVIGMTSLLLDEDLNPEQKDFVETIRTGGEALLAIINDILDFSRLEREKTELEYQPFHLRNTIEEALDLVAARAAEKKLNLAYSVDKITPNMITGDPTRLRQILAILLDNAVKFTEKGEILVSVTSALSDFQYEVHFVVKDTGIGMEPAKMDHLFESFSQLDDSISTKYGGTGLGLAISKKLVALMGGKIWAESDIGKGSTFHFTILAKAISGKPKLARIEPKLKGKRILIVEDNRTNRRILGRQARDWGMMPTTTGSSREAIKLVQGEDSFDIAIIEKALPELDGLALAREIRRYSKTMPLVMLTFVGQGIESDLFAVTLTKPIKPAQLYNVLTDVLAPPFVTPQITAPEVSPEPGTMRILLAEDNLSSQKVTLQMLKKLGYRSDVVANGREVLEALGRQRYDLILMDVRMPEMNGLEATRIIRQRWPDKGPVIIAVTAYGLEGDREKCLAAGMDDYISKPVQLDDLAKMLRKYVAALTSKKASSKGRKTRH
ncbi:MAG: PAS domain S-box protein, partial [Methanotrichaceae archaeon]|nr:PAS domain S-box protein [Methanotrichaceae archaeon]